MKAMELGVYRGHYHNRFDGYNCTWGVLIALGASPVADAFAGSEDYPGEDFDRAYNGEDQKIGSGDNDDFRSNVLQNLEIEDIKAVEDLEPGDETVLSQYWGHYEIIIKIKREEDGKLMCVFDGYGPFEVTL